MIEPAVRVYLPDFDQGILERLADPIQHPALDRDPLPARLWRDKHVGKVFFKNVKPWLVRHQADVRVRSGCLRCGFLQGSETIRHLRWSLGREYRRFGASVSLPCLKFAAERYSLDRRVIFGSKNANIGLRAQGTGDQWSLGRSQLASMGLRRDNTWNMLQRWIGSNILKPITRGQKIFWKIMRYLSRKRRKHSILGNRMHDN